MLKTIIAALAAGLFLLAVPAAGQEETCDGPENIRATVEGDGILVEWDEWTFARAYEVQRATGGGDFETIAVTSGDNPLDDQVDPHVTSYFDADVEAGVAYTYQVQALAPPPELSDICGSTTATAIPVLPTVAAGAAAAVAGLGAYVVLRRTG